MHKALRSMIYSLGGRLLAVDFADKAASAAVLADLQHEFSRAVSATCVVCLLHEHAGAEATHIFPSVQSFEPELIRKLLEDHNEITRRLVALTRMADELGGTEVPERRMELGARVTREANEFFAFYLAHINKEEATIVPRMRDLFTNDQMRAMQGAIMGAMPPERLASYLRWMLPSLNLSELTGMMTGVKHGAPPDFLKFVTGVGAASVDPTRWAAVRERAHPPGGWHIPQFVAWAKGGVR
ncbi:MAG: hemerythrin domain-containing protein [Thermoplasmata archaeon]